MEVSIKSDVAKINAYLKQENPEKEVLEKKLSSLEKKLKKLGDEEIKENLEKINTSITDVAAEPFSDEKISKLFKQVFETKTSPSFEKSEVPVDTLTSIPDDVKGAVDICQNERNQNLERLLDIMPGDPFVSNFQSLEKELNGMKDSFITLQRAFEIGNNNEAANLEVELEKKIKVILDTYKTLGLKKEDVSFIFTKGYDLTDFQCNVQIVLSRLFNQKSYETQVHNFIKENYSLILESFEKEDIAVPEKLKNATNFNIKITQSIGGYATKHNRGKAPLFITLESEGESFKFVFKPRDAQIDKAVFNCFQKIDENLPQCVILNPTDKGDNWKQLEGIGACSLWEFKEGNQFLQKKDFSSVATFIGKRVKIKNKLGSMFKKKTKPAEIIDNIEKKDFHKLTFDHYKEELESIKEGLKKRETFKSSCEQFRKLLKIFSEETQFLVEQVVNLDSVLTQMKIGDQIPQNFIFSRTRGKLLLIPIDLEMFPAKETSIGIPVEKHKKLSSDNQLFVNAFKSDVKGYPVRVLPLATQTMASQAIHSQYHSRKELSNSIINSLEKNYTITVNLDELKKNVLIDLINKDVPYCTLLAGDLFYGPPSKGIKIGESRDREQVTEH